jgi:hypothetical protein
MQILSIIFLIIAIGYFGYILKNKIPRGISLTEAI